MYPATGNQPRYFPATQFLVALLILGAVAAALLILPQRVAANTEEKRAMGLKQEIQFAQISKFDIRELGRDRRDTSRICDLPAAEEPRALRTDGARSLLDRLAPVPRFGADLFLWFTRNFALPPMQPRVNRE